MKFILFYDILLCVVEPGWNELRTVISKIRAKWGMATIGDTTDPNSALCIHFISLRGNVGDNQRGAPTCWADATYAHTLAIESR